MKTAVFFLSASCGGAERMTITIAKLLDREEYDVRFVVIGREIGEIKEFVPKDYPLSLLRIRNIFDFTTLRVYRLLKRLRPQYVFCSLDYLNPRVIQAAKWVGDCKVIVRFNCEVSRLQGINKRLTLMTYPKADVIIAQTEKMQADLERTFALPQGKVKTMHNIIDKDAIAAKLEGTESPYAAGNYKVFVWVGRYDPVKGADMVVKAFIEAAQTRYDISLYMVGKTSEQNEHYLAVRRMAENSSCKERIHFVGFQDNPYKWMKYASCFVLSSRSEGSPNALFEALYLGVPAVVTRCTPNIDDIVEDGFNGFKVKVDDADAMALCMVKALDMRDVKPIYKHSTVEDFIQLFK